MLKYFIGSVFIVCGFATKCQDTFKISLDKFSIKSTIISVKISEIVDARKDKNTIGIVHVGSQNQKDSASLYLPGLQEVEDLLMRSDLVSAKRGYLMRIRKLAISEIADAGKETIKAEIYLDFFFPSSNHYYHVKTSTITNETNAATRSHAENIVAVIQSSLVSFSLMEDYASFEQRFTKEDLMDPNLSFR